MFIKVPSYYMVPNKKGEWMSNAEMFFYSKLLGVTFIIPERALNNLASIPRGFRNIFPVNGSHRPCAALHDHLYNVKGKGIRFFTGDSAGIMNLTRKQADDIFKEAMDSSRRDYFTALPSQIQQALVEAGKAKYFDSNEPLCGSFQSYIMHKAVRTGGSLYWS